MSFRFICTLFLLSASLFGKQAAVTNFVSGRLGDRLLLYVQARWVSEKEGIPFRYSPFPEGGLFVLDAKWSRSSLESPILVTQLGDIEPHSNALYTIGYRFTAPTWTGWNDITLMEGLIDNDHFRSAMRSEFTPSRKVASLPFPEGYRAVALHYRSGAGFDPADRAERWPHKFLPFEFYVEGLSMLARELEGEPLYVHIFTDDPDPAAIARAFRRLFPSIDFGFHESKKGDSAVVQDLMSMARAPYLIRGGSNLSQIAQLIGKHRAVVYPRWKERSGYGPEMMRLSHGAK
jgi:hypothetical protein